MLIISSQLSGKKKQRGIALLVLVIGIALAISFYYFTSISIVKIQTEKLNNTRTALAEAKQLLLGYAVSRADITIPSNQPGRYGFLPCPAIDNGEGNSVGTCQPKNENTFGWLPWRSLGSSPIRDGNSDCLLYAVTGTYKNSPAADMLNEDSNGMFQIVDDANTILQGVVPSERVVAVVFSPGDAIAGQNRIYTPDTECGDDSTNYDNAYLDSFEVSPGVFVDNSAAVSGNEDEVYKFVQADIATNKGVFNDQLITITRNELWASILARSDFNQKMSNLTEALAMCLNNYAAANGYNRLPWPAPLSMADYRDEANYDDVANAVQGYAGRFPFVVDDSNTAITASVDNELFTAATCNNMLLSDGVTTADLLTAGSEYRNLWENWKDHIFYVVSQDYAPSPANALCAAGCVTVDATSYAAIVIFAGSRSGAQMRNGPIGPDSNTKQLIANYFENGNELIFPDVAGSGGYTSAGGNDIIFCIQDGLGVASC